MDGVDVFLELDVAFVGVPFDIGTSNRPGTRFGPRHIRMESVLIREVNKETGEKVVHTLLQGWILYNTLRPKQNSRHFVDDILINFLQ